MRIHEVNELYDGTLNTIHVYAFNTVALNMSNNKIFTYAKAMQQLDLAQFVEVMAKEIHIMNLMITGKSFAVIQFPWDTRQFKQFGAL